MTRLIFYDLLPNSNDQLILKAIYCSLNLGLLLMNFLNFLNCLTISNISKYIHLPSIVQSYCRPDYCYFSSYQLRMFIQPYIDFFCYLPTLISILFFIVSNYRLRIVQSVLIFLLV